MINLCRSLFDIIPLMNKNKTKKENKSTICAIIYVSIYLCILYFFALFAGSFDLCFILLLPVGVHVHETTVNEMFLFYDVCMCRYQHLYNNNDINNFSNSNNDK